MAYDWDRPERLFNKRFAESATFPALGNATFLCIRSKIDAVQEYAEMGVYPKIDFQLLFMSKDFLQSGRPASQSTVIYNGATYRIKNDPAKASDSTSKTFIVKLEALNG